jgi:hypothetical protein
MCRCLQQSAGLDPPRAEEQLPDIMASTTTVGAHKWEYCRNKAVNTWKLESRSIDDDDEEPAEF